MPLPRSRGRTAAREVRVLSDVPRVSHIPRSPKWLASQRGIVDPVCRRCGDLLRSSRFGGRSSLWCPRSHADDAVSGDRTVPTGARSGRGRRDGKRSITRRGAAQDPAGGGELTLDNDRDVPLGRAFAARDATGPTGDAVLVGREANAAPGLPHVGVIRRSAGGRDRSLRDPEGRILACSCLHSCVCASRRSPTRCRARSTLPGGA